jgi:hypothetical protein
MPTKRANRRRSRRRTRVVRGRMRGGCIPCLPPMAPLLGLGGLAGATIISRSSRRTKNGQVHRESKTRFMENKHGRKITISVDEKGGDLKVRVGSKNFKVNAGETPDQVLQRAIKHCEKRGYKGCSDRSGNTKKRSGKRKKRSRKRSAFRHT